MQIVLQNRKQKTEKLGQNAQMGMKNFWFYKSEYEDKRHWFNQRFIFYKLETVFTF